MNEQKVILLVEDDMFVSDIYQTKLIRDGFKVSVAMNGMEAIKKLETEDAPNLILLDMIMPYMDGMDVLKKIKSDEKFNKIPVILLSNLSEKERIDEALSLGADDYLIKSHFTPSEVMEKVNALLKNN